MPHILLIIDGHTRIDADLSRWEERRDDVLGLLAPGPAQPWMVAAMFALTNAIAADQPTAITIATNGSGWLLDVEHTL